MLESDRPYVLLIGLDNDLHLDAAVVELKRRNIGIIRLNPERMNRQNTQVTLCLGGESHSARVDTYSGSFGTDQIIGVWCRYAIEAMAVETSDSNKNFADDEFLVTLKGAFLQIPSKRWINDPFAEAKADNKPHQLAVAYECGLDVPPTIISQRRECLVKFADSHGSCIIKPLGDVPLVYCVETEMVGSFSALLNRSELENGFWDESCPVMLQKRINKLADVRVTVIDNRVFAAKLLQSFDKDYSVDFRNAVDLQTTAFVLPETIQQKLIELLSKLGVRFASCDFCFSESGLYFLEANVSGNYLWTELEAGLPITSAIVDGLISEVTTNQPEYLIC